MKIVFVSNFFNHHQSELSHHLYNETCEQYTFIQTSEIHKERVKLGWNNSLENYVIRSYESPATYDKCINLINDADIVIWGSAPEKMLCDRLKSAKITFRYSERIFKKRSFDPLRLIKYTARAFASKSKNTYYLCSSAYAAADYSRCGVPISSCYKWGYFPAIKTYDDIQNVINSKDSASLLWVARFIDWKHPEIPIEIAKKLKSDGYKFKLNLIGNGELKEKIIDMVHEYNLTDYVNILGSMTPDAVREYMEKSEIFLFTSDRGEGWGAVLNESMNSACSVVASHAIGSVPFLIDDGKNGLIYKDGDISDLYEKVKWLLEHGEERKAIAKNAYHTIVNEWNAENAAKRFVTLSKSLLHHENDEKYEAGPCSKAALLPDNWFKG